MIMPLQLGVFESHDETDTSVLRVAQELGRLIAEHGHVLVTGGATGIQRAAAETALGASGRVLAILPGVQGEGAPESTWVHEDFVVVWSGLGFRGRNLLAVRSCDGAFVVAGGIGTMTEVALALAESVPLSVIAGTGGIADKVEAMADWLPGVADRLELHSDAQSAYHGLSGRLQ